MDSREYRNIAIYLLKKFTSVTNSQTGALSKGLSCSAVAKSYHRFSAKVAKETSLGKVVEHITVNLSYVKA